MRVSSLLMRAENWPLPAVEIAAGVSSYPVSSSLIRLKPCPRTATDADNDATTAMDNPSFLMVVASADSVFELCLGAHILSQDTLCNQKSGRYLPKFGGP